VRFPRNAALTSGLGFSIAFPEIAARPIHHNAVMRAGDIEKPPQNHRAGQANQKRELEVDRLATIDTCRVTFIIGDEPVKNEDASRANPIAKQAGE
jgi:hypothetical protein